MDCAQFANCIDVYLDDELDPSVADVFTTHRSDCTACRQQLAHLEKLVGTPEPTPSAPDGLVDTVMARIETVPLRARSRWTWVAGAVAAAVIVAVVLWPARQDQTEMIVVIPETVPPSVPVPNDGNRLIAIVSMVEHTAERWDEKALALVDQATEAIVEAPGYLRSTAEQSTVAHVVDPPLEMLQSSRKELAEALSAAGEGLARAFPFLDVDFVLPTADSSKS